MKRKRKENDVMNEMASNEGVFCYLRRDQTIDSYESVEELVGQ